jgi:glycerol-3-phosphate dehydrogenase (NAD(P)+)
MARDTQIAVLGGGSWGTSVASLCCRRSEVTLWARNEDIVTEIQQQHTNQKYLPEKRLPKRLAATTSMADAVSKANIVVMGIPSQSFRGVLTDIAPMIQDGVPVISLTKGLEIDTRKRMTEIIQDVLPDHPYGVLTGPNLAREIMSGFAAASVLAMPDQTVLQNMQPLFHSGRFRVYTNHDVIGCELGGVLKNIIAIATGIGDGLGAGDNTRAAMMTRGLAEITRLGVAMGGQAQTFAGLTGMGDLIATCTSPQSRNRTVGYELGLGRRIEDIIADMFMVAEGVKSAPAVISLANEYGIEMPIAAEVYEVLQGNQTARDALKEMLRASIGSEAEPN